MASFSGAILSENETRYDTNRQSEHLQKASWGNSRRNRTSGRCSDCSLISLAVIWAFAG
jgi:hypothetical protein